MVHRFDGNILGLVGFSQEDFHVVLGRVVLLIGGVGGFLADKLLKSVDMLLPGFDEIPALGGLNAQDGVPKVTGQDFLLSC